MAKKEGKTCFVISPIGEEGGSTRKRSDQILKYLVEHVLVPRGYSVDRADKVGEPGIITNQIVKRIVECDVLVADLSEKNPNVFYELALRHGLKKPFIHIIDASEAIPFDNAQVRTIQIDLKDLDSVENARKELEKQIISIEKEGYYPESPISVAFDLETLRNSEKPDEAILATVLEEIASLRREVRIGRNRDIRPGNLSKIAFSNLPKTIGEFVSLFINNGEYILAHRIVEDLVLLEYSPPNVRFLEKDSTPAGLVSRMDKLLLEWTGIKWSIIIDPF